MSKRDIQQRMYREAAEIYQQYLQQDISSLDGFDPLVQMLINACADEISVLETELKSSQIRMLKKLAQLLTPEAYLGPKPAHGVVHLPQVESSGHSSFLTDELSYTTPRSKKLYFTPAGNYNLTNGQVNFIAHGQHLSVVKHGFDREIVLNSNDALPKQTVWLGVAIEQESLQQQQLSFYFDIPFEQNFHRAAEILATSKWSIGGQQVQSTSGIPHQSPSPDQENWSQFHLIRKHEQEIRSYYQNRYLTIECSDGQQLKDFPTSIPPAISQSFSPEDLEKVLTTPSLLWFEISFSPGSLKETVLTELLSHVIVQLNCIPVINRRIHKTPFILNNELNLFPLKIRESNFYGMESVKTSKSNRFFVEQPFSIFSDPTYNNGSEQDVLVYAVRKDGVNRFDKRKALDLMDNILRITREESIVFNALGKNILTNNIKIIQQSIHDINAKLFQSKNEGEVSQKVFLAFPAISLKKEQSYIVATYWSTDGAEGQHIPSGEQLQLVETKNLGPSGSKVRLLTTTRGGRHPFLEKDHLDAFRSALVVRDKIVTEEDIRIYCQQELGPDLENVTINKGVAIGKEKQEGYIRVLKVSLQMKQPLDHAYQYYLEHKLEVELAAKSSCYLPIHISINTPN